MIPSPISNVAPSSAWTEPKVFEAVSVDECDDLSLSGGAMDWSCSSGADAGEEYPDEEPA